jgi:hypothetical protein
MKLSRLLQIYVRRARKILLAVTIQPAGIGASAKGRFVNSLFAQVATKSAERFYGRSVAEK